MIFNLLDSSSLTFVAYTWVLNDTPPTPPWFSCNELFVPSESYFIGQGWKKPTFLLARATSYFYQLQFWYLNIHSGCGDNRHWKGLDFFFLFPKWFSGEQGTVGVGAGIAIASQSSKLFFFQTKAVSQEGLGEVRQCFVMWTEVHKRPTDLLLWPSTNLKFLSPEVKG